MVTLMLGRAWMAGGTEAMPELEKLPPAASGPVDYVRDIRPILERSCLRCHGPERPRSGLRLDTREHLLRGGDGGPVVVISNSAASRLVHAVARLPGVPEELWMPPEGKTPPLSAEEVGLLRAWIDQGLPWYGSATPVTNRIELTVGLGWLGGSGPAGILRSRWQQPDGWNGGLEDLFWSYEPLEGPRFTLRARALRDDAWLQFEGRLVPWGWLRAGVSQYRRYDTHLGDWPWGTGPGVGTLDRVPTLDVGGSWLELGLDRPEWPQLRLGYEHLYREGTRGSTVWSAGPDPADRRLLWPSLFHLEEEVHVLRFQVRHEVGGWRLDDELRVQWTESRTRRTNALYNPPEGDARLLTEVTHRHESVLVANAFRFERTVLPWLRATGGYLYSQYDADGSLRLDEVPLAGSPGFLRRWRSPAVVLEQRAHAGNLNLVAEPARQWLLLAGLQTDWNRAHALGQASFDYEFVPGDWFLQSASQESARDRWGLTEILQIRWTPLPQTVLYAEGRADQDTLEHFEEQLGGDTPLRRDTLATGRAWEGRMGLDTTPWPRVSMGIGYRHRRRHTEFDHRVDVIPTDFGLFPGTSYSAFIRDRESRTDQVEVRTAWQATTRLRLSASYRYTHATSRTATDPVDGFDPITFDPVPGFFTPGTRALGADTDLHTVHVQGSYRPAARWSMRLAGSFHDLQTRSAVDDVQTLPAWAGNTYQIEGAVLWHWNEQTEVEGQYRWALSDFHRDTAPTVLPTGVLWREQWFGVGLRRRVREDLWIRVRYGLWSYDEPTARGTRDVLAHLGWLSLTWRWP